MTWKIISDGIPNLLKDDWHIGYADYFNNLPFRHPKNKQYTKGWRNAWGMLDGYNGETIIYPNDPDYMDGYKQGEELKNLIR